MEKTFLEKRLVEEGLKLCKQRIDRKGTPITVEDVRRLKVKTFSPALQVVYAILGGMLFVFGMWVQLTIGNMAVSMGLVLIGFLNIAYGIQGRPKPASTITGLDLSDLTSEIRRAFLEQQDQAKESPKLG